MIRRILLPIDISREHWQAIHYGAGVAAFLRAELYPLYVASPSGGTHRYEPPSQPEENAARILCPRWEILPGKPAETIARYADLVEADLILMPTRGHGMLGRIILGSTTMDLLRITKRPLWVAGPECVRSKQPFQARRILCGLNLGAEGESVLRFAAQWAAAWGGELMVVHALPEISEAMLLYGLYESSAMELVPEAARRRITAMTSTADVPCVVDVRVGNVASVLRKAAKRWRADIVVVGRGGSAGRTGIADFIARSPCPVITLSTTPEGIRARACAAPSRARPLSVVTAL
jgi:nucleotide-binding universal stress UspA family protein